MPKLPRKVLEAKPTTVALFLLTCLWAVFQWLATTPPPVLDQMLVGAFGVWFANEALDRKNQSAANRSINVNRDGTVSVTEQPDKPTNTEGES
ncbi:MULTISPECIES: hypothetical protein [unclassified Mycolicibacterium]|uniref:hypothetical protein n=1 Tax=unclassified Mycolicibacterium TaxID=2636767 RepID=UPI00192E4154|nr:MULTISPECIES: hypothetical protein [unclassified Mycolicibacterium]